MNAFPTTLIADYDTSIPTPATPPSVWHGETIAGYRIHPYASSYRLLTGEAFEELVTSIEELGMLVPVAICNGQVTDGRNRLRAVEVLRERGVEVAVPTVEWQPVAGRIVEEYIYAHNATRRHLTDDQRAVHATDLLEIIRAQSAARQAATRFGTVAVISTPPDSEMVRPPRSHCDKVKSSTLGRLAQLANVSHHKMQMAIDLADDIAAGLVPENEREAVIRGDKPLRHAGLTKPRRPAAKKKPVEPPSLEHLFDSADDDEADAVTLEDFIRRWERLKDAYPVTEHRELRAIALQHIADEQHRFDQR